MLIAAAAGGDHCVRGSVLQVLFASAWIGKKGSEQPYCHRVFDCKTLKHAPTLPDDTPGSPRRWLRPMSWCTPRWPTRPVATPRRAAPRASATRRRRCARSWASPAARDACKAALSSEACEGCGRAGAGVELSSVVATTSSGVSGTRKLQESSFCAAVAAPPLRQPPSRLAGAGPALGFGCVPLRSSLDCVTA